MSISRSHQLLIVILLLALLLACGLPAGWNATSPPPGDAIATAIAQTQAAQTMIAYYAAETLAAVQSISTATQAVLPSTEPPPPPTATPAWSETPSLTPSPTATFTPAVPMVSVSVDTNCRTGPGKVYDMVGALTTGKSAEVIARDPSGNYWYIRNPNNPASFCWIWGQYATISGNTAGLPVYTPPPTPTPAPDFTVAYSSFEFCAPLYALELTVKNNGALTWQSYQTVARDLTHSITVTWHANFFREFSGCAPLAPQDDLTPGESGTALAGPFDHSPAGENFNVTVTLCTQDNLLGTCVSKTISFSP